MALTSAPQTPAPLQASAEDLARLLPDLLIEADRLATLVRLGEHGRRRAGPGEEFWQYRPAESGDSARQIDWRRSARSDQTFVREREWQAAQSLLLWVDPGRSMHFASRPDLPAKALQAARLGLALAILALRSGERVGLTGQPARTGRGQIEALAHQMLFPDPADFAAPPAEALPTRHARIAMISDFLGPLPPIEEHLARAAAAGQRGILVQILDPAEEDFPFRGRTLFQSMSGEIDHETLAADGLRQAYLARLAERRDRLCSLAAALGWRFLAHRTDRPLTEALLWAHRALTGERR